MAARSLDAILQELDAGYAPARSLINERLAALPGQSEAEIGGLKAQEQDYFDNTIMADARSRGIAFGGIPIGERARYGATQFLPAIARVKQAQTDTQSNLLSALNETNLDQRRTAMSLWQQEQDREAAEREAARSRAAAAAAQWQPTINTGGGNNATDNRPSLDQIFGGVSGSTPPVLRVKQAVTQGNYLQPGGQASFQNPIAMQSPFVGALQGYNATTARFVPPTAPKSRLRVVASPNRKVTVR